MPSPQKLAEKVCQRLAALHPTLKFNHGSANTFFKNTFEEPGFPDDSLEDFTPVWFQAGELLYWEAPKAYYWNPETLDFDPPASDDEEVRTNFLFIHNSGHIASVDDYNGETHSLMPTPDSEELAAYIELHFAAGRERQRTLSEKTPATINGIACPFFNFPDDYSADMRKMPMVAIQHLRATIFRNIADSKDWLFAMGDLTAAINTLEQKIKAESYQLDSFNSATYRQDEDDEDESGSQAEFLHSILSEWQEKIEAERPQLLADARELPTEAFNWDWFQQNHLAWQHPYYNLGDRQSFPTLYLPISIALSESIFAPFLSGAHCKATQKQVFKIVSEHLQSQEDFEQPIPLALPSYLEQVLNNFLQTVLIYKGPELAAQAMEKLPKVIQNHHDSLEHRRKIIRGLKEAMK